MAKIYSYQKVTDQFTTYCLSEPDYNLLSSEDHITELCTIEETTYVSIPNNITLPEQSDKIKSTLKEIDLSNNLDLKEQIKTISSHINLINDRVVEKIRTKFSINDEIKILRAGTPEESNLYNAFVEECVLWGRIEKEKLGV